jgi:hypothetical protein
MILLMIYLNNDVIKYLKLFSSVNSEFKDISIITLISCRIWMRNSTSEKLILKDI